MRSRVRDETVAQLAKFGAVIAQCELLFHLRPYDDSDLDKAIGRLAILLSTVDYKDAIERERPAFRDPRKDPPPRPGGGEGTGGSCL